MRTVHMKLDGPNMKVETPNGEVRIYVGGDGGLQVVIDPPPGWEAKEYRPWDLSSRVRSFNTKKVEEAK